MFTVVTSSPKSFTEILFSPGASADDILDTDGDLDVSGGDLDISDGDLDTDGDQDRDVGEVVAIVADEEWSSDDFELSSDSLQLDDTHHIEAFYDSDTLPFTVYDYRSPEAISEVVTTYRGASPANLDVSMRSDDENLAVEDGGGEEDSGEVWLDVDDTGNASEESEESTSREVDGTVTVSSESSDESSEPEYTDTSSSDEDEVIDVEIISTDESDSAVVDDTYLINDEEEEEDDEDHNQDVIYDESQSRYYEWEGDSHYLSRVGAQPASSSSSSEGDGDGATSDERERVDYVRRPSSEAISTSGDETARRELPAVTEATEATSQAVAAATAASQAVVAATEATALDVGVASTSTGGPGAPSVTASPVGGAARSPAKCDASPNRKRQRVDEDPDVGSHSRLVFFNK